MIMAVSENETGLRENEMSFKAAHNEMRQMATWFRAFDRVDEVLRAATGAESAQKAADELIAKRKIELAQMTEDLSAARAKATEEQRGAAAELAHLREVHFATETKFKADAEETRKARERAANEMSTASELIAKQLKGACETLEAHKKELTEAVALAQGEWDAMRERMGVT